MQPTIEQWESTWHMLGLAVPNARWFESIIQRYSEPHRHYHTVRHLEECFAKFDELRSEALHPGEVELALWFHDGIYNIGRHDNEEKSAEWACKCLLENNAPEDMTRRIYALIMATRHHEPTENIDAKVLVDVDLSILAASPERFQEYEQQIRAEYKHVPLPLFNYKRKEALEGFLRRPRIFNTGTFFERYEQLARRNIKSAL